VAEKDGTAESTDDADTMDINDDNDVEMTQAPEAAAPIQALVDKTEEELDAVDREEVEREVNFEPSFLSLFLFFSFLEIN
jgi:predicted nucleotidyltransferase